MTVIKAVATKEAADTTVGISIAEYQGQLFITKIKPDSLFAGSELQTSMEVLTINGVSMAGKEPSEATAIIRDTVGEITILASKIVAANDYVIAAGIKEAEDSPVGLSIGGPESGATALKITKVKPDGLFGSSDLKAGMRLISINNIGMKGRSPNDALVVLKMAQGDITILAQIPPSGTIED
jgi:C-terminal processing protease CtpA/Prc